MTMNNCIIQVYNSLVFYIEKKKKEIESKNEINEKERASGHCSRYRARRRPNTGEEIHNNDRESFAF